MVKLFMDFDWNSTFLTPEQKFNYFQKLKSRNNIFCGDSLPDLLPSLYSNIAFAFPSHDREFLAVCNKLREKFSRNIYIVNDFNGASRILEKLLF